MTGEPPVSGDRALPPNRERQASQDAPSQRRDKRKERALVGSIIAQKYRVLDVLGQGGFGTVYLVEMVAGIVGDRLAMKILPPELGKDEKLRDGFIQEIRVAMRMVSRYIVQIRDVGVTDDGLLYYTMDYMPGRSLREVLREEKVLSPVRAVRIALRVLRALVAAHNAGVIHRDLKPANIMVDTRSGKDDTKVLDFGIATVVRATPERPTFAGSPHYMPPEQFLGTDFGFYTDTYAVGVILYECLTGRRPFDGRGPRDVYERLKAGPPARVDELAPEVEKVLPGLSALVHKAIERNPERRFQTAREFFNALQLLARGGAGRPGDVSSDDDDDSPADAVRPAAAGAAQATASRKPRRSKRARKRSALPWALVVVGAAAATGLVAWMIVERTRSSGSTSPEVASQRGSGAIAQPASNPQGARPTPGLLDSAAAGGSAGNAPAHASNAQRSTSSSQPAPSTSTSTPTSPSPSADATPRPAPATEVATSGASQESPSTANLAGTAATETPARSADELYEEARRLVESGELEKARKILELATRIDESHTSSYELAAHVLHELGDSATALRALEQARKLRGGSLGTKEQVLLARLHLAQSPPAYQNAREILLEVRKAEPENADATALLARIYEHQADDERLVALLNDATKRSIEHPVISELHETYIASVERRRDEEHEKHAKLAVEAFSKGSYEDAITAALEGSARRRDPGLELLVADARYRLGRLEESEAALARARDLLRAGSRAVASPTVWRPEAMGTSFADWIELFQAAIDYQKLRSRADDAKRRAEARSIVERVRAIATASAGSTLADLAAGIEVAARGLYADGPSELDQLLRGRGEARLPEIAFFEAEGYMHIAHRLEIDAPEVARAREDRLRQLRVEIASLEARRRAIERDRSLPGNVRNERLRDLRSELNDLVKEGEKLQKEKAEYESLKKLALETVATARGRIIFLTRRSDLPPDVVANAYYQLGLIYLHQGRMTEDASTLRTATNRLLSAIENGRHDADIEERLAETYALRKDHANAALRFHAAFDLEPTVARCLAAARSYVEAIQRHKAREILFAGRDRFPDSKEIRKLLDEVDR